MTEILRRAGGGVMVLHYTQTLAAA